MAQAHRAGALDVRNVIGLLLAIYGGILTGMGLFADKALDKTGGVNANLIAGLCLLVAGGGFMLWARLRPIVIPEDFVEQHETEKDHGTPGHLPGH